MPRTRYLSHIMNSTFISDSRTLLAGLPALTGDAARLAHRLSQALDIINPPERREPDEPGERIVMTKITDNLYAETEHGHRLAREATYDEQWVLRNARGQYIDHDQYRCALEQRCNLKLVAPYSFP